MQNPNHPSTSKPDDAPAGADRRVETDEDTVIMSAGARAGRKSGNSPTELVSRRLLDCMSDGLLAIDMTGRFVEYNPAAEAIHGRDAFGVGMEGWKNVFGLYLPDMQTPYPTDELPLARALRGETTPEVEVYVRNDRWPDGKWLRVRASPTYDNHGRQIGATAILRDDTERKQTEQALATERRFLRHLIQTQDRDRQLTAYDLHDGVVQLMTGALMRLEAYRGKHADADSDDLQAATDLAREAIDEARRMIGGLRPPEIDEKGVIGAIDYLASPKNQAPLKVEFIHDVPFERLTALQETTIFRIVQEALHNAHRHSGSERARVILRRDGNAVFLEIRDWGKGFDTKTTRMRRFGLRGIEERSRLLGGTVYIESSPGQGTMIRVSLPLDAASSQEITETES